MTTPSKKPNRTRSPAVQAGYLHNAVTQLRAQEEAAVEAARAKHRGRIDALISKAPEEVRVIFKALDGAGNVGGGK